MNDKIKKILENANENELESIIETVNNEINNDTEPYDDKAMCLLQAYIDNNVDAVLIALCGWSLESILTKSGLLEDTEGVFIN